MGSYLLIGDFNNLINFLLILFVLSGVALYYFSFFRSCFCKGCHLLIDVMAYSLKAAVNTIDNKFHTKKHPSHPHSKLKESYQHSNEEKYNRHHNHHERNYTKINKEVRSRDGEWVESHLSSDGGLELQRESFFGFKWTKEMTDKRNNDILHLDNDTINESYNYGQMSNMKLKNTSNITDSTESIRKKRNKKKRQSKRISYSDYPEDDDDEMDQFKEKLRKLHKKIRILITIPDKNLKQQKELETLKMIEDLLEYKKEKIEKSRDRKLFRPNAKNKHRLMTPKIKETDGDDEVEERKLYQVGNADSSRPERKSTTSSRKESRTSSSKRSRKLSSIENKDLSDDSDDFSPPIIYDRVTPVLKNIYRWIFGGCPSSK